MKRIALIIALAALTSQAADVVLYSQTAPSLAYPAPVARTGQTNSYAARDDGALTNGVAWPNPRFTVQVNTNCVVDNLTGLMWARNANIWGVTNWAAAVTNCNALVYGGYTDWRLPNCREMVALSSLNYSGPPIPNTSGTSRWSANDPFVNVVLTSYWTSSTVGGLTTQAMVFDSAWGGYQRDVKTGVYAAWPCRGP